MDKCPEHGSYISPTTRCPQCAKDEEDWIAEQAEREQRRQTRKTNYKLSRISRKLSWHSVLLWIMFLYLVILPVFK